MSKEEGTVLPMPVTKSLTLEMMDLYGKLIRGGDNEVVEAVKTLTKSFFELKTRISKEEFYSYLGNIQKGFRAREVR